MKKIGIFTLDGIVNYGNRLQNYALKKILENEGFEVDTIVAKGSIIKPFLFDVRTVWRQKKRALKFIKFNRKYIGIKRVFAKGWDLKPKFAEKYDYFVVGSDQVWNPNIRQRERNNYFLRFAKPHQRISVAASLSVEKLEGADVERYKDGIGGFKAVSVREYAGAEIIKNVCDREATVVCDPTVALEKSEWDKLAKTTLKSIPENYMLVYFLGKLSAEREQDITAYADKHGLEIVCINNKLQFPKYYNCGPEDFLWLIKNASAVCTDSFHGVAFSSIFNIPFWAFAREDIAVASNMESRITSLQKKLGIEGRLINKLLPEMELAYDYSEANKNILSEQQIFKSFLREALDIREE